MLLNISFQGQQIPTMQVPARALPSTSGVKMRSRASTSTTGVEPMTKKYKCLKYNHQPFVTKYELAQHMQVKHAEKGMQCDICGKSMEAHHLEGHRDIHAISSRFTCKEKMKKTGLKCGKGFKQK